MVRLVLCGLLSVTVWAGDAQPWVPTPSDEVAVKAAAATVAAASTDDPPIPGLPPRPQRPERLRHLRNDTYAAVTNPRLAWIHVEPDKMEIVTGMLGHPTTKAIIGHTDGNDLHILWYDEKGVIRVFKPFDDAAVSGRPDAPRIDASDVENMRKERLRRIRQLTPLLVR